MSAFAREKQTYFTKKYDKKQRKDHENDWQRSEKRNKKKRLVKILWFLSIKFTSTQQGLPKIWPWIFWIIKNYQFILWICKFS